MSEVLEQQSTTPAVVPGEGRRFIMCRGYTESEAVEFDVAEVLMWRVNADAATPMVFDNDFSEVISLDDYAFWYGGLFVAYRLLPSGVKELSEEEAVALESQVRAKRSKHIKYLASPECAKERDRIKKQYEIHAAKKVGSR